MTDNLKIWDALKTTDPAHTKKFTRAGGFKGTAIKPIYMVRKMTEMFGPAGKGWGMGEPAFKTVECGEAIMVYCTVSLWWGNGEQKVYGVGGDTVQGKNRNGVFVDDEAFKKAYTDAMSNAMKQIGVGADVHMGQHDDDKYVATVSEQLHGDDTPHNTPSNGAVKVEQSNTAKDKWTGPLNKTKLYDELRPIVREFEACDDLDQFICFKNQPATKAICIQAAKDMPVEWMGPLEEGTPYREYFAGIERKLTAKHPMNGG